MLVEYSIKLYRLMRRNFRRLPKKFVNPESIRRQVPVVFECISSDETNRQGRPFRPPPCHCSRRHFQEHHSRQEIEGSNTIGLLGTGKKLLVLKVMIMDDFSMEW